MKNIKKVLILTLNTYNISIAMEQPPQAPQRNLFSHLPADVKEYLLPFVVSGTLKDMTRGLYNLAALDKKHHAWINDPERLKRLLDKPSRINDRLALIELLQYKKASLPAMQSYLMNILLHNLKTMRVINNRIFLGAISENRPWQVSELLENGCIDVNFPNIDGERPLVCSVRRGNLLIIEMLLAAGADPNIPENNTGIFIPSGLPHREETFRTLLNANVPLNTGINGKFGRDQTALYIAIMNGNTQITRILLEAGAVFDTKDYLLSFAQRLAKERGYHEILTMLEQNNHLLEVAPRKKAKHDK